MPIEMQHAVEREIAIMGSFAEAYGPRFEEMIRQANGGRLDPTQSIRLCVEAMSMLLDTQARLARMLSAPDRPARQVA